MFWMIPCQAWFFLNFRVGLEFSITSTWLYSCPSPFFFSQLKSLFKKRRASTAFHVWGSFSIFKFVLFIVLMSMTFFMSNKGNLHYFWLHQFESTLIIIIHYSTLCWNSVQPLVHFCLAVFAGLSHFAWPLQNGQRNGWLIRGQSELVSGLTRELLYCSTLLLLSLSNFVSDCLALTQF